MHANAERVAAALRAGNAPDEIRELDDSAATAIAAAGALGVPVGAIVKSLVFAADGSAVLVLASGDHLVDTAAVAALLDVSTVKRADVNVVRTATGFPIGGVAPIGHPAAMTTIVDTHLAHFQVIWAAAGTPDTVFATTYTDLLRLTGGRAAAIGLAS